MDFSDKIKKNIINLYRSKGNCNSGTFYVSCIDCPKQYFSKYSNCQNHGAIYESVKKIIEENPEIFMEYLL